MVINFAGRHSGASRMVRPVFTVTLLEVSSSKPVAIASEDVSISHCQNHRIGGRFRDEDFRTVPKTPETQKAAKKIEVKAG
jgi:hypothetical protein